MVETGRILYNNLQIPLYQRLLKHVVTVTTPKLYSVPGALGGIVTGHRAGRTENRRSIFRGSEGFSLRH